MTSEVASRLLDYNPETGVFLWRKTLSPVAPAGSVAGTIYKNGRRYITIGRKRHFASRLAWLLSYGVFPVGLVDHKNLNRSDDRLENLRLASRKLNSANQRAHRDNRLGIKGVVAVPRKQKAARYRARIRVDGQLIHLGYYPTLEQASSAYTDAAREYFGEFARTV